VKCWMLVLFPVEAETPLKVVLSWRAALCQALASPEAPVLPQGEGSMVHSVLPFTWGGQACTGGVGWERRAEALCRA